MQSKIQCNGVFPEIKDVEDSKRTGKIRKIVIQLGRIDTILITIMEKIVKILIDHTS